MLQFYVVINTSSMQTVYTGSLHDCAVECARWAKEVPNTEFVYCKVTPVGTHTDNNSFRAGMVGW